MMASVNTPGLPSFIILVSEPIGKVLDILFLSSTVIVLPVASTAVIVPRNMVPRLGRMGAAFVELVPSAKTGSAALAIKAVIEPATTNFANPLIIVCTGCRLIESYSCYQNLRHSQGNFGCIRNSTGGSCKAYAAVPMSLQATSGAAPDKGGSS